MKRESMIQRAMSMALSDSRTIFMIFANEGLAWSAAQYAIMITPKVEYDCSGKRFVRLKNRSQIHALSVHEVGETPLSGMTMLDESCMSVTETGALSFYKTPEPKRPVAGEFVTV
jgi:hypothetical protein